MTETLAPEAPPAKQKMTNQSDIVSFDDTQTAFAYKSDSELSMAYWLFRMINYNFLVKMGPPMVRAALALHFPIKSIIKATVFSHFCGGETISESKRVIKNLAGAGVKTILDFSGEGKESEADFAFTFNQLLDTIEYAKNDSNVAFCVFKTTGLARHSLLEKVSLNQSLSVEEQKEFDLVKKRVHEICNRCAAAGIPVFIDAEESWIQKAIDDLALEMMRKFNTSKAIVYNTLQMYRTDRLEFLKQVYALAEQENFQIGIKFVRGAYLEKERLRAKKMAYTSPLHVSKENTDKDFDASIRFSVEHAHRISVCAGTHNERSNALLMELMEKNKIARNDKRFYFSQLYGMSDNISFSLAKAGYNVSKYVPFGPVETVLPYLFRRAEENTAIAGQMGRELSFVIRERNRRKSK